MKRAKKYNDPVAMTTVGKNHYRERWAAESGNVEAHFMLGIRYDNGEGVEKDMKRRKGQFITRKGSDWWSTRC